MKVPTTSSTCAVGPVVGRICAAAQKPRPVPVGQPQHQVGEGQVGDDLPVRDEQLRATASSAASRSACARASSVSDGTAQRRGRPPAQRDVRSCRCAGVGSPMTSGPEQTPAPTRPAPRRPRRRRPGGRRRRAVEGHSGSHAVAVAAAHGVETMFTLSGAHVFPMYDARGARRPADEAARRPPRADRRVRRRGRRQADPGAGARRADRRAGRHQRRQPHHPGASSAARRWSSSAGGRRPTAGARAACRSSTTSPLVAPVTKSARTVAPGRRRRRRDPPGVHAGRAPRTAARRSSTCRWTRSSTTPRCERPPYSPQRRRPSPTPTRSPTIAAAARRGRAARSSCSAPTSGPTAPRRPPSGSSRTPGCPPLTNGMGRGMIPGGHPLLVTKARVGRARPGRPGGRGRHARWTSGSPTASSAARTAPRRRRIVHLADSPAQVVRPRRARRVGVRRPHAWSLDGLLAALGAAAAEARLVVVGRAACRTRSRPPRERDRELLDAEADPIHPARIYGELLPRLADDAVVIGDGGDFVSFAGKYVEPQRPGGWLDPGPYGCLGAGHGRRHRGPARRGRSAQVVLLLRRRCRRHVADGRRHPGAAQPAGRHGHAATTPPGRWRRARCRCSTATTSIADLAPRTRVRRGGDGPGRRRRDGHRPEARSGRPWTGRSPRTCPTWSTSSPT